MTARNQTHESTPSADGQALPASTGSVAQAEVLKMLQCPHRLRANILRHGPPGYELMSRDRIERIIRDLVESPKGVVPDSALPFYSPNAEHKCAARNDNLSPNA